MRRLCCLALLLSLHTAWALSPALQRPRIFSAQAAGDAASSKAVPQQPSSSYASEAARLRNSLYLPGTGSPLRGNRAPSSATPTTTAPPSPAARPAAAATSTPVLTTGAAADAPVAAERAHGPKAQAMMSVTVSVNGQPPVSWTATSSSDGSSSSGSRGAAAGEGASQSFDEAFNSVISEAALDVLGMEHVVSDRMHDLWLDMLSAPSLPRILDLVDAADARAAAAEPELAAEAEAAAQLRAGPSHGLGHGRGGFGFDFTPARLSGAEAQAPPVLDMVFLSSGPLLPLPDSSEALEAEIVHGLPLASAWEPLAAMASSPSLLELVDCYSHGLAAPGLGRKLMSDGAGQPASAVGAADVLKVLLVAARRLQAANALPAARRR